MLSGSIWDKMILFALPLAFTGVPQQLYNAPPTSPYSGTLYQTRPWRP